MTEQEYQEQRTALSVAMRRASDALTAAHEQRKALDEAWVRECYGIAYGSMVRDSAGLLRVASIDCTFEGKPAIYGIAIEGEPGTLRFALSDWEVVEGAI